MLSLSPISEVLKFSTITNNLNIQNPEHLEYQSGILNIAVLGGIRLEGLDRLRTTLKIQVEHLAIRHNLDLYNDTPAAARLHRVCKLKISEKPIER